MTPKDQGYYMPAEWAEHQATWLSYPHNEDSWPGKCRWHGYETHLLPPVPHK